MKKHLLILTIIFTILAVNANAQFKKYKVKGGAKYEQLIPTSEYNSSYSFIAKGFVVIELSPLLGLEIGAGYGQYKTKDNYNPATGIYDSNGETDNNGNGNTYGQYVNDDIIPVDARLRVSPWAKTAKTWNPYLYIGAGAMYYNIKDIPDSNLVGESDWAGTFPGGIGTEIKLSNSVLLDFNLGYTYTTTDLLNNFVVPDFTDGMANIGLGLTFGNFKAEPSDIDGDGLTNDYEKGTCTDYRNPDTDGDRLKDGAEVNQYKTDPCNKDTDGDGLIDGDEVMTYSTNPLNKDSDNDKLTDGEEINTYRTLPNDSDTDDDMLIDGDEVLTYKTDPKIVDTDVGSIGDGVEVNRGTNPLNPEDDLPKPVEEPMKVGAVIILEGINFASGSYQIDAGSDEILEKAYVTMRDNPEIFVEISGHTDSQGGYERNITLSQNRAGAVKEWLVAKGIDGSRIEVVGYGPDKPIASNDTPDGRYQNRRIEFKRTK